MAFQGITIDPKVAADYPAAKIGWLIADVKVRKNHPHVDALKKSLAQNLAERSVTEENISAQPDIAKWRAVYGAMGVKPSKYRSSLEALTRRVVKGQEMWSVSSVVDCYNCVSVLTSLPMGAHDTSRVEGTMTLRYGREGEKFLPLGDGGETVSVDPKNILYADESKVCCWLWNHRDTRLAAVTEETEEALFIVDTAFPPHLTSIRQGLKTLAEHLERIGCTPKESSVIETL